MSSILTKKERNNNKIIYIFVDNNLMSLKSQQSRILNYILSKLNFKLWRKEKFWQILEGVSCHRKASR